MTMAYAAASSGNVALHPALDALPGSGTLQALVNGLGAWALIAALVGLVIGAAPIRRAANAETSTARLPTIDC
jgi:hypothetical protein